MDLQPRLRPDVAQGGHAAGLRARVVVLLVAAGREVERVGGVGELGGGTVAHGDETRLSVGKGEALGEETRRARMVFGGAGPEDAVGGADLVVGDAAVVGAGARRGPAELGEDLFARGEPEARALAQALGQRGEDLEVGLHAGRGRADAAPQDHAPLEVGHRAVLLGPLGDRQDDVRGGGGLVDERVADDQQLQRGEALVDVARVRRGDGDVRAEHQQRADAALGPERVEELVGALPLAGQRRGVDAPDARDRRPVVGIFDQPVAGELIGLLAVLAPPLTVALTGQAAVAAVRLADLAEREHQVGERDDGVGPFRLLLGAAPGEQHAALGLGQQVDRAPLLLDRHAGHPLDVRRVDAEHGPSDLVEPDCAAGDVVEIDQAIFDRQVQKTVGQEEVGPRRELEVQLCGLRGVGAARIDDDQRPLGPLRGDPLHERRHRVGDVRAPEQQRLGLGDVADRKRQPAVDPEGAVLAGRRRGHAVAAVVVDVRRAERQAGELAQQVGLLVGQRAAAERRQRLGAVRGANRQQPLGDEVERGLPAGRREAAVGPAQERRRHPLGVVEQVRRGEPLGAHLTAVDGERVVRADLQRLRDGHPALERAIRAVCSGGERGE